MSTISYDINMLPVDQWVEGSDGDNSELEDVWQDLVRLPTEAETAAILGGEQRMLMGAGLNSVGYVPFKRTLKQGMEGPDVRSVHRALRVASGELPGTPTKTFGPFMKKRLIAFQKKKKLKADGVYGLETHKKLALYFDAYGAWLMGQTKVLTEEQRKRQLIVSTAMLGYNRRYYIHYTQSSLRMQGVRQRIKPPGYPRYEDCSSFSTWCYWVAGMSDPNGLGYSGFGYTGTLGVHGQKISTAQMQPGDLIFYGRFPYSHVTVYVGDGLCVSHGSEVGPLLVRYNYRYVSAVRSYI